MVRSASTRLTGIGHGDNEQGQPDPTAEEFEAMVDAIEKVNGYDQWYKNYRKKVSNDDLHVRQQLEQMETDRKGVVPVPRNARIVILITSNQLQRVLQSGSRNNRIRNFNPKTLAQYDCAFRNFRSQDNSITPLPRQLSRSSPEG